MAIEYSEFEDSMIKKLYPIVSDKQLAIALNRPVGGIYARRVKLKVRTKTHKIVPDDLVLRIETMLLDNLTMSYIDSITEGVNEHNIMVIRDKMFFRMNQEKPKYIVDEKSFVNLGGKNTFYWKDEDQIMESLDPKYDPNELTGWELEIFNNNIKSEYKLQVL